MEKSLRLLIILLFSITAVASDLPKETDWFNVVQLPNLPDSLGVAGAYAGVSNGALVVAGGANFPIPLFKDNQVNPDAKKVWWDNIYVLESPDGDWINAGKLPRPLAYGASVTTSDGIICIGGSDANQFYADVFKLAWMDGKIKYEQMLLLPYPCANLAAGLLDSMIYAAGGQTSPDANQALNRFMALDLSVDNPRWVELEPLPGSGRILAVAAVQDSAFYVVSGCELVTDEQGKVSRNYLTDGYRFRPDSGNPAKGQWSKISDVPVPVTAAPTPAYSIGQTHFMIVGGEHGKYADRTMELRDKHPGFSKDIYAYHTITDTWTKFGKIPAGLVTATGVMWNNNYIIPSGEIRPGTRSPEILSINRKEFKSRFGILDYTTLILYLLALVGIGFYFSKKGKTTNDYFLGGGRLPWWASGLSIFATMLSAITFMAIPAKAFATNWVYILQNIPIFILAPLIIALYLPMYRRLNVSTAYEYLEKRFNLTVRLFGSAVFVLFHIGRMAIVLYLPAIVLTFVIPLLNVYTCLILMGILCTVYTFMGGIEAVVWTDSLQAIVLLGAALLSIIVIISGCKGGFSGFINTAIANNKFDVFNWSGDTTVAAAWIVFVGGIFNTLGPYSSDQTIVQRYMTSKTEKQAAKSIWTNAIISMPASVLFFGVGTALYVYYKSNPQNLVPGLETDAIFPLFIVQQLPAGLTGFVLAGLFAACQSTLSSSLNSVSAVIVTDFYKRLNPQAKDSFCLRLAKVITIILGVAATLTAMFMVTSNIRSLWDVYLKILALFGGGLTGLFILGMFTKQANSFGALTGAVGSGIVLFWIQNYTRVSFFLYSLIGIAVCVGLGLVTSLIFKVQTNKIEGLTIYTVNKSRE